MKKTLIFILFFCFFFSSLKSQVSNLTYIKLIKDDSTMQSSPGDTSYIFNAFVLTYTIGGITSFTLTSKTYDKPNTTWIVNKDTVYTWSAVSASQTYNQVYALCKRNNNLLKVCLGRLDPAIRRKFIFRVTGSNGILTKEFNF